MFYSNVINTMSGNGKQSVTTFQYEKKYERVEINGKAYERGSETGKVTVRHFKDRKLKLIVWKIK